MRTFYKEVIRPSLIATIIGIGGLIIYWISVPNKMPGNVHLCAGIAIGIISIAISSFINNRMK